MPPAQPELRPIADCLRAIRNRLWRVRLLERSILALQWGALVALPLTACALLRQPLPWEQRPWTACALACLPLGGSWIILRNASRLNGLGISPALVRGTAALTALWPFVLGAILFLPLGISLPIWSIPLVVISTYIALAAASVRPISDRAAAIFVDQQVGLQERVSTALEMLQTPADSALTSAFRAPVLTAALQACQQVRAARVGCRRLDSRLYASAAAVAVAAAALTLLPPVRARAAAVRQPSAAAVAQGRELRDVLKEIENQKLPGDQATPEMIKPLESAITQLQDGTMSPIESSALLSQTRQQLQQEQAQMEASQKVADALKDMNQTRALAQAAQALKDAQMAQAQGDPAAGQKEQAAQQVLQDAAKGVADKMNAGQMSEQDKKDVADKLQAAADQAQADPQLQKSLQDAAKAAQNGDGKAMAQSLADAGQRMGQQGAQQQLSHSAMSKAMSQIEQMQQQGGSAGQSTMGDGKMPDGNSGSQANSGNDNGHGQSPGNPQGGAPSGSQGGTAAAGGGKQPGGEQGTGAGAPQMAGMSDGGGSTMLENKGGSGGGGEERPLGDVRSFVRVYDPTTIATSGDQKKVGSYINPLQPASGSMQVMGPADDRTSQIKNYADVLPEVRQQAMDEMSRQDYPAQYQDMVKAFYGEK